MREAPADPILRAPMRRYFADSLRYLPARLVPALVGLAIAYLFTRALSTEGYGLYMLVLAIVQPAALVLTEWVSQPTGRFYSEYRLGGRLGGYRAVLLRLWKHVLLATLAAALLILALGSRAWGVELGAAAALYLVALVVFSLLVPLFPASLDAAFYGAALATLALLHLAAAGAIAATSGMRPAALVWGAAIGTLVCACALVWRARRHLDAPPAEASREDVQRFARYGFPMLLWVITANLLHLGDFWIIQLFRGNAEVGIYAANYQLATGVSVLLGIPVTMAAFPIVARLYAAGEPARAREAIASMTAWFLLMAALALAVTAATSRDIVHLVLGSAFREGHLVILPVLAGQVLWLGASLGQKGLELTERTRVMLAWGACALALNIVLNVLFVPRYGYVAAAYTTFASYLFYAGAIWRAARGPLAWDVPWSALARYALLGTAGAACAGLVPLDPGAPGLAARACVAGVTFLVGSALTRPKIIARGVGALRLRRSGPG